MTISVDTQVVVPAPRAAVWALLADPTLHPSWSPNLALGGDPVEGALVPLRVRLLGRWLRVWVRVVRCVEGEELAWEGGLPGLFVGRHHLRLSDHPQGTLLDHGEVFRGLAVPALWPLLRRPLEALYASMNHGLVVAAATRGEMDSGGAGGSPGA